MELNDWLRSIGGREFQRRGSLTKYELQILLLQEYLWLSLLWDEDLVLLLLKETKCNILKLSDGSLMDLIKNSTSDRSSR